MNELKDFDILSDLVTYTFIDDIPTKQALLEELDVKKRLQKVLRSLRRQNPGDGFPFSA